MDLVTTKTVEVPATKDNVQFPVAISTSDNVTLTISVIGVIWTVARADLDTALALLAKTVTVS